MNEKYYRAMDNLVPPEEAVEKMLAAAEQAERYGKVLKIKSNRKKLTAVSVIAASLALIITLGAIFCPETFKKNTENTTASTASQNSFFLVASAAKSTDDETGAQKLSSKKFVKIGRIIPNFEIPYCFFTNEEATNSVHYFDEYRYSIFALFDFDIWCSGENISRVKYDIENAVFFIDKSYGGILSKEKVKVTPEISGYIGEDTILPNFGLYRSYTVDYKKQYDMSIKKKELEKLNKTDMRAPIQILGRIKDENIEKHIRELKENGEYNKESFKQVTITVTAIFKDGTSCSQKVRVSCEEGDPDVINLKAKVIE